MNKTNKQIKFHHSIKVNGEALELTCYMNEDDWYIANVSWHGMDITNLLSSLCSNPFLNLKGEMPLYVLDRARKHFNQKYPPQNFCNGITVGDERCSHTFLYN